MSHFTHNRTFWWQVFSGTYLHWFGHPSLQQPRRCTHNFPNTSKSILAKTDTRLNVCGYSGGRMWNVTYSFSQVFSVNYYDISVGELMVYFFHSIAKWCDVCYYWNRFSVFFTIWNFFRVLWKISDCGSGFLSFAVLRELRFCFFFGYGSASNFQLFLSVPFTKSLRIFLPTAFKMFCLCLVDSIWRRCVGHMESVD